MELKEFNEMYSLVNRNVKELESVEDYLMSIIERQFEIIKDRLNDGKTSVLSVTIRHRVDKINELYKTIDLIDNIINAKERN